VNELPVIFRFSTGTLGPVTFGFKLTGLMPCHRLHQSRLHDRSGIPVQSALWCRQCTSELTFAYCTGRHGAHGLDCVSCVVLANSFWYALVCYLINADSQIFSVTMAHHSSALL